MDRDLVVSCGEVVDLVTVAGDDPADDDIVCDDALCDLQIEGMGEDLTDQAAPAAADQRPTIPVTGGGVLSALLGAGALLGRPDCGAPVPELAT